MGGFVLCLAGLLYAVFRPEPPPDIFSDSDKWGHVLALAALAFSARLAFTGVKERVLWPLLLVVAPLLEVIQGVLRPARMAGQEDALANIAGVVLAWMCYRLLCRYLSERVQPG